MPSVAFRAGEKTTRVPSAVERHGGTFPTDVGMPTASVGNALCGIPGGGEDDACTAPPPSAFYNRCFGILAPGNAARRLDEESGLEDRASGC